MKVLFMKAHVRAHVRGSGASVAAYERRDRASSHQATRNLTKDSLIHVVNMPNVIGGRDFPEARRNAIRAARQAGWLGVPIRNAHSGIDVVVGRRALEHTFSNGGDAHIRIVSAIPELIRHAVIAHREAHHPPIADVSHVATLWAAAEDGKGLYRVKLKIKERANGEAGRLYDVLAVEIEDPAGFGTLHQPELKVRHAPAPGTIKLGDLLAGVNEQSRRYVPRQIRKSETKVLFMKARPTPAQAEAGNYRKPTVAWRGLRIAIENPKGSTRQGTDVGGHEWKTTMQADYGYIRGSKGLDDEQIDCYVGTDLDAPEVYVVNQMRAGDWLRFDEQKCMIGFKSEAAARAAYLAHYDNPKFLGSITTLTAEDFVHRVKLSGLAPRDMRVA